VRGELEEGCACAEDGCGVRNKTMTDMEDNPSGPEKTYLTRERYSPSGGEMKRVFYK
jgi:hypothetical protein